jgi:hypothetical protein
MPIFCNVWIAALLALHPDPKIFLLKVLELISTLSLPLPDENFSRTFLRADVEILASSI